MKQDEFSRMTEGLPIKCRIKNVLDTYWTEVDSVILPTV